MKKYIGRIVQIIYEDRKGDLTQRKIEVLGVRDGKVRAKCLTTNSPRLFNEENILAMIPAGGDRNAS